jgi:mannose-1-phosphate guanylyltransferase
MKKASIFGVILAGGASSRLFPFNNLTGTGKPLLRLAWERAHLIISKEQLYVLCAKDLVSPMQRQLRLPKRNFFLSESYPV